jgi:hypothetical protein
MFKSDNLERKGFLRKVKASILFLLYLDEMAVMV